MLAIYLQVQTVQTEIEQLKGQIQYLEESADLSSISVRLIAEESTQPISIGPWTPSGTAKDAIQDLILFFQNFVEFLIRFVLYTLATSTWGWDTGRALMNVVGIVLLGPAVLGVLLIPVVLALFLYLQAVIGSLG